MLKQTHTNSLAPWLSVLIIGLMLGLAACASAATPPPVLPTSAANPSATSAPQGALLAVNCNAATALTPAVTEGPYFKSGSPERASLLDSNIKGTKLVLTGVALTRDCKPSTHALLDFWQADANGQYDNAGYTLRGHQFSDGNGMYQLTTIVPGLYPGRTEHIHVKVQAPGGPILTTQLFFPGVTQNSSDGIFDPTLLLTIEKTADGLAASFDFVVSAN